MALPPGTYPIGGAIVPTLAQRPPPTPELRDALVLLPDPISGGWLKVNDAADDWVPVPAALPAALVPIYKAEAVTYDAASAALEAELVGVADADVPALFEFYLRCPADLDRASDDLSLVVGGESIPLVDVMGAAVAAKQLTPNCLHKLFVNDSSGQREAAFAEALPERLKDYPIRAFVSVDRVLDAAEIAESTESTPEGFAVMLPQASWTPGENRYFGFGVPEGTPLLATYRSLPSGFPADAAVFLDQLQDTAPAPNGIEHVWWVSKAQVSHKADGRSYEVTLAEA